MMMMFVECVNIGESIENIYHIAGAPFANMD